MKHTQEPWRYFGGIFSAQMADGAPALYGVEKEGRKSSENCIAGLIPIEADAARIISCVNACQGLNPEAVPELLEACKLALARESAQEAVAGDGDKGLISMLRKAIAKATNTEAK